ncbi:PD-(D/E)XK nuclease family protein [Synechocystis salina]|uniref:PD-(D/E)XK nuclease family protein n=1 Tax=Synechocystis salina LEGE 00031 TaxID=1828736 RepID=A0ABR9VP77_9SYNC|nr:PD-(D/E)XK nuclease family protein [Synechocystis salina]MBE9239963.1 PD-(D/E)XK nuclease family protein [Synechocystis salina LEGE 00041]MBE9253154.1 PD-(D/E)XK nuclease family protein [Synechocystis salina LEGE 00031]
MSTLYVSYSVESLLYAAWELSQDLTDDSGWQIVTPNRNAADTLEVPAFSLQQLAWDILKIRQVQAKVASRLVVQHYLRETLQQTLELQDLDGMARTWQPTIEAILRSQPDFCPVSDWSERAQKVFNVAQIYQKLLRGEGWIDQNQLFWEAIKQQSQRRRLVIYGYFNLRLDELAFIEAIADENSVLYLLDGESHFFAPQKKFRQHLKQNGWAERKLTDQENLSTPCRFLSQVFLGESAISPEPDQKPQISAQVYPNQEAEARGVLAQVKQLLHQGVLSRDMVIVAANDTEWGDRLMDIAWEYGIALRLPYTIPIAETRVGAWVKLLLEVLDQQWTFELAARFFQHPLSRTLGSNLWAQFQQSRPTDFETWRSLILAEHDIDIFPMQLPLEASRPEWLTHFQTIFDLFQVRQQARRWAKESLAYKNWTEGLQELPELGTETITWAQFREEMLTHLNLLQTVAGPGREGIELHNPRSIVGAQYDYVFVIDGREGNLPKPIVNDAVLDFYERQQLQSQGIHLASAMESAQSETFDFYTLLQTPKKSFIFSYAKTFPRHGSYKQSEPSSYFQRLGLIPEPTSLPIIPSPEIARQIYLRRSHGDPLGTDDVLTKAIHAWQVEQQRESSEPPNEYDGVVGMPFNYEDHWFSASQLTQLGQCPFKWFANKLLKLGEIEEADSELDSALKGSLYHKVLEIALSDYQKDSTINLIDDDKLMEWFQQAEKYIAEEKKIEVTNFRAWDHQRQELIKILKRAMLQPDFLPEPVEILALEQEFAGEIEALKVKGYIDRIDRREEGLVLIDYKSGGTLPKGIKDQEDKAKIDLQLPLYKAVGGASLYPGEHVAKTLYYSLSKAKDISPRQVISETELREILEGFKQHFQTGTYPVSPDRDRDACRYCTNELVCRQGDRLQRKGV